MLQLIDDLFVVLPSQFNDGFDGFKVQIGAVLLNVVIVIIQRGSVGFDQIVDAEVDLSVLANIKVEVFPFLLLEVVPFFLVDVPLLKGSLTRKKKTIANLGLPHHWECFARSQAALVLCWESLFDTEEKAAIIMIMIIIMIAYDETF